MFSGFDATTGRTEKDDHFLTGKVLGKGIKMS
jgi:hypothetical protein